MRLAWLILVALAFALPARAQAPDAAQAARDATIARVLASGDGRGPASAYVVARAIEAHSVILHLRTPFLRQRSVEENATVLDIWTVRGTDGAEHEIHFRVPAPDTLPPEQREAERNIRRILTSGDGLTPETAFVVGGAIPAEYAILRLMGLQRGVQGLIDRAGCYYDVQRARDPSTGETREVWFRLGGSGALAYTGRCVPAGK